MSRRYTALTQIHPPLGHHPDFDNASRVGIYGDITMEVDYTVGWILDAIASGGDRTGFGVSSNA